MENETDDIVTGVSTLSMAVEESGPLSFVEICELGAEVAARLADAHADGEVHGHVAPGSVVRLADGPWRLAPADLVGEVDAVEPPEAATGAAPSAAADVYALGATLSYGLTGVAVTPVADGAPPSDPEDDPAVADAAADGVPDRDEPGTAMTLPEVMSAFLVVLRASLAADPAARPEAADLAGRLDRLRADAEVALIGGPTAVRIGDGPADPPPGAAPLPPPPAPAEELAAAGVATAAAGALAVEGTGATATLGPPGTTKRSLKDRVPLVVAVVAVVVAAVLGVSLLQERNDRSADLLAVGPTVGTTVRRTTTSTVAALPVQSIVETTTTLATSTTSSTSTTLAPVVTVVETTAPTTEAPTTTAPPTSQVTTTVAPTSTTTVLVFSVKVSCATPPNDLNPCRLFEEPSATSTPTSALLANGSTLQATCKKTGPPPVPGAKDTWLRIVGPDPYDGWLSVTHLGGADPTQVPPCK